MRVVPFAGLSLIALVLATPRAHAQSLPNNAQVLLDVPFVAQSEALCGGAAAAMVLRYWNATRVYAEDFAPLVGENIDGISVGDLTRALAERGWTALAFAADKLAVRGHLARGRPVIALIEDRPGRNHYVVVVAWTQNRIVFHDPARGPFRVVEEQKFDEAWRATGRVALLITPLVLSEWSGDAPVEGRARTAMTHSRNEPEPAAARHGCEETVNRGIGSARAGDLATAETLLSLARDACPNSSAGSRELAGIRFLQRRWPDAARLSAEAIGRDPSDAHAWQLLASARYLDGDEPGALAAWNQRDEPRVDVVEIAGLSRTPIDVVNEAVNLPPGTLLTERRLRRAVRRVTALPTVTMSRVGYTAAGNGLATLDVALVERPVMPRSWPSVAVAGIHAATARAARLDVASPTGNGELWTIGTRWWTGRPRIGLSFATPQFGRWRGLWRLDAYWERQSYQRELPAKYYVSDRRHAEVTLSDWISGRLRWELGAALDHWHNRGSEVSVAAGVEGRLLDDRLALRVDATRWPAIASGSATSAWRSSAAPWPLLTAKAGAYVVTVGAPLDIWPAVDTGLVRGPLLRAHPLLKDDAIRIDRIGRVMLHGTMEWQKALIAQSISQIGVATFVDAALLGKAQVMISKPFQFDVGAGLRAKIAGAPGHLRVDIARGIRDGRVALSVVWQEAWPR